MPRAQFQSTDYSNLFADLYKGNATTVKDAADSVQSAADSDMYDRWQADLVTDSEWLAYIGTRLSATVDDPKNHQRWVELQRQVNTEASKEAKAAAKTQQDANDADAYDSWKNGLMGDDEWLAYIAARASAETDPKAHQNWVELQRQYTTSIADSQAQAAFEDGTMSGSQYIAYLKRTLVGMDKGSSAYRERQGSVVQLIDTQLSNDTTRRAQEIVAGIQSGKNDYAELLALYKGAKKNARPGSSLAKDLDAEIAKVDAQIAAQAAEGALQKITYQFKAGLISGKEAGKRTRAAADLYYKGDETKYYQVLEGATEFEAYPGMYADGAGKRGGGGGGVETAKQKAARIKAQKIADSEGIIARIWDISDQYLKDPTANIKDNVTGDDIPRDKATIHQIQLQGIEEHKNLIAVYEADGDSEKAGKAGQELTNFIRTNVRPSNTVGLTEQWEATQEANRATIEGVISTTNDPLEVINIVAKIQRQNSADRLALMKDSKLSTASQDTLMDTSGMETRTNKLREELPTEELLNDMDANNQLLLAFTAGASNTDMEAAIATYKGLHPDRAISASTEHMLDGIYKHVLTDTGLKNGSMVLVSLPGGGPIEVKEYKPGSKIDMEGNWSSETTKTPDYELLPGQAWEKIQVAKGGAPMDIWAVSEPAMSPYKGWQAQGEVFLTTSDGRTVRIGPGDFISSTLIDSILREESVGRSVEGAESRFLRGVTTTIQQASSTSFGPGKTPEPKPAGGDAEELTQTPAEEWKVLVDIGAVASVPYDLGWRRVMTPDHQDGDGSWEPRTEIYDPKTGKWYQGNPPGTPDFNIDGTIRLDVDRNPTGFTYEPHGDLRGVPTINVGDNGKQAQAKWNLLYGEGMPQDRSLHAIDDMGNLVPATWEDNSKIYHDPTIEDQVRAIKNRARDVKERSFRDDAGDILPSKVTVRDADWQYSAIADIRVERARKASSDKLRMEMDNAQRGDSAVAWNPSTAATSLSEYAKGLGITLGPAIPKPVDPMGPVGDMQGGLHPGPVVRNRYPIITQPKPYNAPSLGLAGESKSSIPTTKIPSPAAARATPLAGSLDAVMLPPTTTARIVIPPPAPARSVVANTELPRPNSTTLVRPPDGVGNLVGLRD